MVSAGTGTKCLSHLQLPDNGDLLHDSHAEIIAIRAFKRYLVTKLENHIRNPELPSIFEGSLEEGFDINPQIKFHFYTTHPPCGDATIFPVTRDNPDEPPPTKRVKVVDDSSFTGAKLIGQQDGDDVLAQDEGAVRIKPGRGERTLSMSCSDKLAKVLIMGVQGCLLTLLLKKPIYLESFILSKNSGYHRASLERALYKRFSISEQDNQFQLKIPELLDSTIDFPYAKDEYKSPCPKTIIWCGVKDKPLEISVDGRRQGVAKKNINKKSSRLKICRIEMFREFYTLLQLKHPSAEKELQSMTYSEVKSKYCPEYMTTWTSLKRDYFKNWTTKPEILQSFKID